MSDVQEFKGTRRRHVTLEQLVTIDDLQQFKIELLQAIKNMLPETKGQPSKKWLKSYEVKKMLKISTGTLQNLRTNGTIPFTKIGGIIYYDSEDIDRVMQKQKFDFAKKR